ncbi:MAG: adenine deaminase [Candidatus Nitrosocosmicus sp.]
MKKVAANLKQKTNNNKKNGSLDHLNFPINELKKRIDLAIGQKKADLVIKNANIVNVFSGEIYNGSVAIADGIYVGIEQTGEKNEEYTEKNAQNIIDAQGKFMCPGLIDGHIHIESTFLSPHEFCKIAALHGTSSIICDPHEIANVLGLPGIDYLLSNIELPVKIYIMMPSCVPATHMETSGAEILDIDIRNYFYSYPDSVIGLAEMMNYPGVISKDDQTLSKIVAAGARPKDGHAPLLSGKYLNAYIISGLGSDHECTNLREAQEKLRKGMHIMVRQGTQEKNLQDLIPLINDYNSSNISLVSDDRDVIDLEKNGHMDYLVRTAISFGISPIRAIQMATINTARYFGLKDIGAIAPGFKADFMLLDDFERFKISDVFLDGKRINKSDIENGDSGINSGKDATIYRNKKIFEISPNNSSSPSSCILQNSIHIKVLDDSNMFAIPAKSKKSSSSSSWSLMQVIGIIPGQIITKKLIFKPKVNKYHQAIADPERDLAKLAVIERHHKTGNLGLGFVQGFGLKKGAIASSVAHDSHNLVVAGMSDEDMLIAAKHISSIGGGLVVVDNLKVTACLPLPIAGLISDQNSESVISNLKAVNKACIDLGQSVIKNAFMLLSFLSLPVIPSLKLTDKGLIDVDKFEFTNLWINNE